jgi:AcrR family transcriptional regulator
MVSSGIYRYCSSRDELLTALIIDSYDRLGEATENADRSVRRRSDFRGRWRAIAHSIRDWAVQSPSEWALLYGTPVPGYAAPEDTIVPASRYSIVLLNLLADIAAAGVRHEAAVPRNLKPDLARMRTAVGLEVPDATLAVGLVSWAAIIGSITLELFSHLHNVVDAPGALFEAMVEQYGAVIAPG